MLRSGTQLEGSKGISDEVGSERKQEKGVASLPSRSEPQKKRENENEKESKTLPFNLTCPLSHFHKDLLKLSWTLNLASFLIFLRSCMLMFHF